jgi:hypothetical protein
VSLLLSLLDDMITGINLRPAYLVGITDGVEIWVNGII